MARLWCSHPPLLDARSLTGLASPALPYDNCHAQYIFCFKCVNVQCIPVSVIQHVQVVGGYVHSRQPGCDACTPPLLADRSFTGSASHGLP